jgi:hypothetical protein
MLPMMDADDDDDDDVKKTDIENFMWVMNN